MLFIVFPLVLQCVRITAPAFQKLALNSHRSATAGMALPFRLVFPEVILLERLDANCLLFVFGSPHTFISRSTPFELLVSIFNFLVYLTVCLSIHTCLTLLFFVRCRSSLLFICPFSTRLHTLFLYTNHAHILLTTAILIPASLTVKQTILITFN